MHPSNTLEVGRDGHQASMAVASVANEYGAEVVSLGTIGTRQGDIDALIRKRHSHSNHLVCIYAAGPWGAWRSRDRAKTGDVCWVVAPALSPKQAGDRVKPARRAAGPRARLLRSGDLTPVCVPRRADEALRALTRAKFRLHAFRRRQDLRSTGQAPGRPAHRRWLAELVCPTSAPQSVFQAYVRAVTAHPARLRRLAQALHEQVTTWPLAPEVEALQALRGVQVTVAVTLVAELGDLTRGETPASAGILWA